MAGIPLELSDKSLPNLLFEAFCHLVFFCSPFQVSIPSDPVELSFWVAMNLPIDDAQRLRVLQMDCAVPRLRMELSLLKKVSKMQSYIF